MEIDPDTGRRSDGCYVASDHLSELSGVWLDLSEQIRALEVDLRAVKEPEIRRPLQERLRASLQKLTEIDRQHRAERQRLNALRFPER